MRSEIGNLNDKLDTLMTQGGEEGQLKMKKDSFYSVTIKKQKWSPAQIVYTITFV